MNNYSSPPGTAGNATDAANTRAFLQQAVDHYPRQAVLSFTLVLPYSESIADYRSLILRFHTEVWQRTGAYSRERQQARQNSPPTILRWLWESASAPECRTVLMMNLNTLGTERNPKMTDGAHQALNTILSDAWQTVTGSTCAGVTTITPLVISRTGRDAFTAPFNQLTAQVKAMTVPVTLARTGVICA